MSWTASGPTSTRSLRVQGLSPSANELGHLVPLELGGAPADAANLWPEVYEQAWGARVEDRIENKLDDLVCAWQIPLADAQQAIAADWVRSIAPSTHVIRRATCGAEGPAGRAQRNDNIRSGM